MYKNERKDNDVSFRVKLVKISESQLGGQCKY